MPWPEDVNDDSDVSIVPDDTQLLKPDISVTGDRNDRRKVVHNHERINGDMLSKDVSLIRMEVQEQGCRTNIFTRKCGIRG